MVGTPEAVLHHQIGCADGSSVDAEITPTILAATKILRLQVETAQAGGGKSLNISGLEFYCTAAKAKPCGCEQIGQKYCNYEYGATGFCELCAGHPNLASCRKTGLSENGADDCEKWCWKRTQQSYTLAASMILTGFLLADFTSNHQVELKFTIAQALSASNDIRAAAIDVVSVDDTSSIERRLRSKEMRRVASVPVYGEAVQEAVRINYKVGGLTSQSRDFAKGVVEALHDDSEVFVQQLTSAFNDARLSVPTGMGVSSSSMNYLQENTPVPTPQPSRKAQKYDDPAQNETLRLAFFLVAVCAAFFSACICGCIIRRQCCKRAVAPGSTEELAEDIKKLQAELAAEKEGNAKTSASYEELLKTSKASIDMLRQQLAEGQAKLDQRQVELAEKEAAVRKTEADMGKLEGEHGLMQGGAKLESAQIRTQIAEMEAEKLKRQHELEGLDGDDAHDFDLSAFEGEQQVIAEQQRLKKQQLELKKKQRLEERQAKKKVRVAQAEQTKEAQAQTQLQLQVLEEEAKRDATEEHEDEKEQQALPDLSTFNAEQRALAEQQQAERQQRKQKRGQRLKEREERKAVLQNEAALAKEQEKEQQHELQEASEQEQKQEAEDEAELLGSLPDMAAFEEEQRALAGAQEVEKQQHAAKRKQRLEEREASKKKKKAEMAAVQVQQAELETNLDAAKSKGDEEAGVLQARLDAAKAATEHATMEAAIAREAHEKSAIDAQKTKDEEARLLEHIHQLEEDFAKGANKVAAAVGLEKQRRDLRRKERLLERRKKKAAAELLRAQPAAEGEEPPKKNQVAPAPEVASEPGSAPEEEEEHSILPPGFGDYVDSQ
jgi:hypothetical protein